MWLMMAVLSAVFAGLTSILAKCGIRRTDSDLATALRTVVVLVFSWGMAVLAGSAGDATAIGGKSMLFLLLSGAATGASWLCYYRALQQGPASAVVPIDKMSVLITVGFSCLVLHEKLSRRALAGLVLLTAGTLAMIF